jgi:hypothetical protein
MPVNTASVDLPVSEHTVSDARALALELARAWDTDVSRLDLALLVDDLSDDTVARLGEGEQVVLRVTHDGSCLRVELTGPALHGSTLVEHAVPASLAVLAEGWGDDVRDARRHRWFELGPSTEEHGTVVPPSPGFDARLRASLAHRP